MAAVRRALVEVGAQGPVDELEVRAEDPVLVEARDRLEAGEDPLRDRVRRGIAGGRSVAARRVRLPGRVHVQTRVQARVRVHVHPRPHPRVQGHAGADLRHRVQRRHRLPRPRRVEAGVEEADEVAHEVRVRAQGVLYIGLAEAEADLAKVLRVRPQHGDLAPVEAGREGEAVEAVVLRVAGPDPGEATLERLADRVEVRRRRARPLPEPKVVEPHLGPALPAGRQHPGVLVLDPKAHVLEHREGVREVDRPPEVEELEAEGAGVRPGRAEEVHREGAAGRRALPTRVPGRRRPGPRPDLRPGRRPGRGAPGVPLPGERDGELDVTKAPLGAVAAAVPRAERRHVPAPERGPRLRPEALDEHPGERPAPPRRRLRGGPPAPGRGHRAASSSWAARIVAAAARPGPDLPGPPASLPGARASHFRARADRTTRTTSRQPKSLSNRGIIGRARECMWSERCSRNATKRTRAASRTDIQAPGIRATRLGRSSRHLMTDR